MSESRHHNQARNIVEYAWRFRNHNDDIPRQYLTDILVGNIAEALRLAYATSHEKEYQDEKARRVYYQDIVYDVCNTLDRAAKRSVSRGQGIVCGTIDEPHDNVQTGVKALVAERDAALAEVERVKLVLKDVANALAVVPLGTTDRMRAAGLEYDAKFVDRAMAEWHNVNAALAPAQQQEKHTHPEGAPMPPEIDAEVVSTPADTRPEPGPFPDQYAVTCFFWNKTYQWVAVTHGAGGTLKSAETLAQRCIKDGNRRVRIVRIPGENP